MKIASHGPEAIAGAVATLPRKSFGFASLEMHDIKVCEREYDVQLQHRCSIVNKDSLFGL